MVLLCFTLLIAGCTTGASNNENKTSTVTPTTIENTTTPVPGTTLTSTAERATGAESLHKGEYYRLNTTVGGPVIEFEVLESAGEEVTVKITGTPADGNSSTTTVRGTTKSVFKQVINSQTGFGFFLLARAPTVIVDGRDLVVGETFTVDSTDVTVGGETPEPGTFSVTVTGTDTVNGIDCTTVKMLLNNQSKQTACVNPDLLFAPRTTLYNDEGESTGSIVLEEYRTRRTNGTTK